jgi:hypothetical protein
VATLELRLDALTELLESPHLALEAAALLEQLPPQLDKARAGREEGSGNADDAIRASWG